MEIRRKSDNLLLSDVFTNWSPWFSERQDATLKTVTGVPYLQAVGVKLKVIQLECLFSSSYANSSEANFDLLVNARHGKQTLVFTDYAGQAYDCRVYQPITPDDVSRWEEVRTKTIFRAKFSLYRERYEA